MSVNIFIICFVLLASLSSKSTVATERYPESEGKLSERRDVRIRREFTSMSIRERARFVRAFKIMSTRQPFKRRYEYLVNLHSKLFKKVHVEKQFFPWHRWYLLEFENLLRRVDPRVNLAYWDWSLQGHTPWQRGINSVWNNFPWGLGGNGSGRFSCVNTGPFGKYRWRLARKSGGGCLRRNFMGRMPSVVAVHLTLRSTVAQFKHFEEKIRKFFHNELHCCIQGTMELKTASNTPEFLLHHTFMDKIWFDWQQKGPEYRMKLEDNMESKLRGSKYVVGQFMDPNHLGKSDTILHYKDPFSGYKRLHDTLKRLDLKSLTMLDPYVGKAKGSHSCCPKTPKEIEEKVKELQKSQDEIPLEVALDYGE